MSDGGGRFEASLGRYEEDIHKTLSSVNTERFAERLWAKDASLWSKDPAIQTQIKNRLGWLTVTESMREEAEGLMGFAREIKEEGFRHLLLLGMGGSSLCPEVCQDTYGVAAGYPGLVVLDSTDPATILRTERSVDLGKTLLILASKSGTTIEVHALFHYFSDKLCTMKREAIGGQCIAITDHGTGLEKLAREHHFRRIFLNPPDIGGRYSALSYFGLVPAALIGMDIRVFLDRAGEMVRKENPGVKLGVILGELAKKGRDKITFLCSPAISSFGYWVEQLLAESTGKEGKGLVPVEGEELGSPEVYGHDRLFIFLGVTSAPDEALEKGVHALEEKGHPVVRISLSDPIDLAGEFFRWEVATAVAGALLGINPFDEPNVTESKENTRKVLEEFQKRGQFPTREAILEEDGIGLYADQTQGLTGSLREGLRSFLSRCQPPDYVAIMAYIDRSPAHDGLLRRLRRMIRDRYHVATTVGYGPRFLHSTGQLHKGGPKNGFFLQITAEDREDLPVPGEAYTFGVLKKAQACGDFLSLANRGLPVLEIHLGRDTEGGLRKLVSLVEAMGPSVS